MDSAEVTEIKRHIDAATEGFRTDVADVKRHFGVVAERMESRVQLLAEGLAQLDEKVERRFTALESQIKSESEETRAMIRLSYTELDRRIRTLESGHADLETRVERLEAR